MELGYTLLYVDDVEKTMEFYSRAFELSANFLHESKQYGEMATGQTRLGFVHHETASSHGFDYARTESSKPPPAFEIGLITEDVEGAFKRALEAGAVTVAEPDKKPWGQVVSYVRDLNGFLVEICSPVS